MLIKSSFLTNTIHNAIKIIYIKKKKLDEEAVYITYTKTTFMLVDCTTKSVNSAQLFPV